MGEFGPKSIDGQNFVAKKTGETKINNTNEKDNIPIPESIRAYNDVIETFDKAKAENNWDLAQYALKEYIHRRDIMFYKKSMEIDKLRGTE